MNPFIEDPAGDEADASLAAKAAGGDRDALERLVRRHQAWLYNIAVRMVCDRSDAEDVTQEVLLKVVTKLSTFEGRSGLRTWLYRIASNHVLNMRRRKMEGDGEAGFGALGQRIASLPDHDLQDPNPVDGESAAIVNETKIRCTTGMLLCLDRRQRLAFVLGDSLGVDHAVGAAVMEVSPDNFRQLLARARRDLFEFMRGHCGLVFVVAESELIGPARISLSHRKIWPYSAKRKTSKNCIGTMGSNPSGQKAISSRPTPSTLECATLCSTAPCTGRRRPLRLQRPRSARQKATKRPVAILNRVRCRRMARAAAACRGTPMPIC